MWTQRPADNTDWDERYVNVGVNVDVSQNLFYGEPQILTGAKLAKVAFIGAGSTVFARNLLNDLLGYEDLRDCLEFRLHDIDLQRLATSEIVARKLVDGYGAAAQVSASTDLRTVLDGADYVITMFQVGGFEPATVLDFDLPEQYGLEQTIADTIGIGGIMRGLRTVPVLVEVGRTMSELCADAVLLNYANPMAINMWGLAELCEVDAYGLCHSVPITAQHLASDLGLPVEELDYLVAGINHMAFFLRLEHKGRDLYPELKKLHIDPASAPKRSEWQLPDAVRYEMLRRLDYFVTESSEHFAEYTPYFLKRGRPDLIERFEIPVREYVRRCENQIAEWDELRARLEAGAELMELPKSDEFAPQIIHSLETGKEREVYVNVPNHGLIDNLPTGCIVEVPATVDGKTITPSVIGKLPPQLAALMGTNIAPQQLTVEALKTGHRDHIYHAAMLDPHTAAELDLEQIWSLVDALIEGHGEFIPEPLRKHHGEPT